MITEPTEAEIDVSAPARSSAETGWRKWMPLSVMSLALVIMLLDTTILTVTMKTIVTDLHTTLQSFQWVISSYSLMLASFTITGGRLGDIFGRKRMFLIGATVFAAGSFITSISPNVRVMLFGEAIVEGAGAALMMPATATLLRTSYHGHDRRLAFGVWGGIAAGAAALGPMIGGWLTTNYSWRWAFRINVGVVALLLLGSALIKESRDREERPTLDYLGVLLSSLGLFLVVFGFIEASTYGWWFEQAALEVFGQTIHFGGLSATPVFVGLGAGVLALFAAWEHRMRQHGQTPLVSLKLFRNGQYVTATGISSILAMGQAGLTFSIPVYLQGVLKLDPMHTGLAMIPMTVTLFFAAPFSAVISRRVPPKRIIQAGIVADAMGFLVMRQSLHAGASPWELAPGLSLFGLGLGLMMAQTSNLALSAISAEESGEASGVNTACRLTGSTLGAAMMGAIMISALAANLVGGVAGSAVVPETWKPTIEKAVQARASSIEFGGADAISETSLPPDVKEELARLSNEATVDAGKSVLGYGAIFVLCALFVSWKLPSGTYVEIEKSIA